MNGDKAMNFSDVKSAERVFHWFLEISKIPRGSGNTGPIADFLVKFAKKQKLEYLRDEFDNVVIKKPASRGFEKRPAVIIQGHSDIVAERTPESKRDMTKCGVEVYRDGDFLRAKDTTLGGDDGIALAYALALLEDKKAKHPPIEAVFTTDEETGLTGAVGLDTSALEGKMLINLDSETEGNFTVGCAGGIRADLCIGLTRCEYDGDVYEIGVCGLKGGHSGVEIGKGRSNAVKVLAEVLAAIGTPRLVEINGGTKDNAIPRSAYATVLTKRDITEELFERILKKHMECEPDIKITCKKTETSELPFDKQTSASVITALGLLPFGVTKMSEDIKGLVETSMNVGIVKTLGSTVNIACSIRSAKAKEKTALLEKVKMIAKTVNAEVSAHGDYPAWEYKKDSRIRDVMCGIFKKMYGKDAKVLTIHAGLECGIFSDKIAGLDAISIGPNMQNVHTTEERLSVSSSARVWEFLCEVLKNI